MRGQGIGKDTSFRTLIRTHWDVQLRHRSRGTAGYIARVLGGHIVGGPAGGTQAGAQCREEV